MGSASDAEAPTKGRIAEAVNILKQLGLPRQQQNDRSGLTLLALLDLRPTTPWKEAQQPTLGIHDMRGFFAEAYQAEYAENTRETVRRQTLHQLDENAMRDLWIELDPHGKIPDVILHDRDRNWLILIEAVTSHGPIDPKRHIELNDLFRAARAGLVYVTAFPSRSAMAKYLGALSWETEVWAADEPDHLMHFNGERFLGPYPGHAHPQQTAQPERLEP